MIQTLVLTNSVNRRHSQISMRILSLTLFHKFIEIRACGLQRTPDVICLTLVSVPGRLVIRLKCNYQTYIVEKQLHKVVISLKSSFTTVCRW